ncbi:hypothetical protein AB7W11_03435 [Providencia manganoxydans]|uniref:hypothetical protein n=1 Tax=Providencia manganoxydans TaxID=2923283 RepID=UPI0034E508FD
MAEGVFTLSGYLLRYEMIYREVCKDALVIIWLLMWLILFYIFCPALLGFLYFMKIKLYKANYLIKNNPSLYKKRD